jgi:hypothetical protein
MRRSPVFSALMMVIAASAAAQSLPADGRAVIQRMRDRYDGRWYGTLTFVQRTIKPKPSGGLDTTLWYESMTANRLRIDDGDPAKGNGVLYTPSSLVAVRNGSVVATQPNGNPFLPLVMGAYLQPVDSTVAQLTTFGFDLSKVGRTTYDGRETIIVGARDTTDTTSPQFWIEADRLLLTRMRFSFGGPPLDIRVGGYKPVGNAWLGTHIDILNAGKSIQLEEYTEWKTDPVSPDMFDVAKWMTVPHWAKRRP